jgi:FMNH2-dependent dimethyl sulfone monooxygenase
MSTDMILKPLESAAQNSLMLGLFLPIQSGAWSPSTAPRVRRQYMTQVLEATCGP